MAKAKKTWKEKLDAAKAKPNLPKVFYCEQAKMKLVVPSPAEVEALMRGVRRGKVLTIGQMQARLKTKHQADMACPLTTGIFSWLVAHAAAEAAAAGARKVTPWWRVVKTGGVLNPKFPGGGELQCTKLIAEGHQVLRKGKKLLVAVDEA